MYLKNTFLRKSEANIKEGPQIRELIKDVKFEDQLREVGKKAWKLSKNRTTNFLGNQKVVN